MNKAKLKDLISKGFKPQVALRPNKQYSAVKLEVLLRSESSDIVYPIYYNHCKSELSSEQIRLISIYNEVKNYQFRDLVEINIAIKENKANKSQVEKMVMHSAIKKIEFLELI